MFEQEVGRTLEYIARGIGVRIVGASGSGRTIVAQKVVAELEKSGATAYYVRGLPSHRRIPFAGINGLGLDIRIGALGVLGVADVLAGHVARPGAHILVVDDIEFVDNETLAVLDAVQLRMERPLVATLSDSALYTKVQLTLLSRGPEAHIQLNPLRYEQVNELISHTLGAPADANATARILTKSAGNPRLVVRISETASLSDLLTLTNGQWHMTGDTLWNDHLRGTVEALLEGLSADELTGLQTMAIAGNVSIDMLQQVIDPNALDTLERRGFVSVMEDPHDGVFAAISPPVVADYFRAQRMLTGRRVLRDRIARVLNTMPQQPRNDGGLQDSLMDALTALRFERSADDASTSRYFHEQIQALEHRRYELWSAEKSVSNAAAFLRVYWGAPTDTVRIERVLEQTPTSAGEPGELLFLMITKALWAVYSGQGLEFATGILRSFGTEHPDRADEAEMAALFLVASYDRMPENLDEILARLEDKHPESGVLAGVRGMLELYRLNPSAALNAIDDAKGFEVLPHVEPFVRGMALFSSGRIEESLVLAVRQRAEARRNLDQFGMVSSSYLAAQALIYRGYFDEAEYLMSSVFALGRPGFLVDSLHDAMLRLAGLRGATSAISQSASVATQARPEAVDIGPLPGTGKGVYELIVERPIRPAAFDTQAANLIEQQLDRGYVLEAAYSALFFVCLLPSRRVLELLRRTLRGQDTNSHAQLVAIAAAVVEGNHQLLGILLRHYEPDADIYQVRMLLRGASKRHVLLGDTISASAVDRASAFFAARFPLENEPLSFDTGGHWPLTVREIEVAALAGQHSNTEIAEHLGISIRTVENHISNALRKTGTTSRSSLFELMRHSSMTR